MWRDHFCWRWFPFFCLVCSSVPAVVSVCQRLCRVGLFSCLLFCWLSSQAGIVLPQKAPPARSLGVTEGILSFPHAAAGAFRNTEMSSHWERCLQHSVSITISHFKRCHSTSSFHFLIGDRSVHESLWCKVVQVTEVPCTCSKQETIVTMYSSLRRKEGVFLMSSGNDSLYIMFPPHR